jgi:hypothetical protein
VNCFIDILFLYNDGLTYLIDICISCTAIAWQKKSFRKYFDKVENYEKFHCFAQRLLQAPTIAITRMLQKEIVLWLTKVEEARAAAWFNDNWTGERGNYTIATAGYVGNHLSWGIESNWRYMRRDVVGCAGTSQRIYLPGFTPSSMQYLSIRCKKHADKILCPKTGAHKFPSEATYITSKLWKMIQEFKVHRLLLCYCEAS